MYAMSQHQYVYAAPPPPPPRQFSGHGTSSAFSSSANPDEDWTQISDLGERRRIQNRIAQRNYRKKLKKRLEDLERRAGTSDGTSSSAGAEKTTSTTASSGSSSNSSKAKSSPKKQQTQQQTHQIAAPVKPMPAGQFTPPMHPEDNLMFPHPYDERERSHTPPMFAYPTYSPPEDMMLAPYAATPATQSYRPLTTEAYPGDWATSTVPVTLPSMTHFHDSMSYGFVPNPMDMGATAYDSNPHTPPLSHSFDHSTTCSDSGYEYPTTPLSMPGSPGMTHHH